MADWLNVSDTILEAKGKFFYRSVNQLIIRQTMKTQTKQIPLWNRLKTSAKTVAALAAFAGLATVASAQITYTPFFIKAWDLQATAFADMPTTGNNMRGVGISPLTTNVLYGSTASATNAGVYGGGNHVSTVSFASGSNYISQSKTSPNGAQVNLTAVRVSDDGYVYGCNVTTTNASFPAASQNFQVFRWASETDTASDPLLVFSSTNVFALTNSGWATFQWRIGDFMDVRGSGINTEIVVSGNGGAGANVSSNIVVLRPTDASATFFTNFSITIPGGGGAALAGRGIAFEGTNNAVYFHNASSLRRMAYTPAVMTSGVVNSTNGIDGIGLDYWASTNGVKLVSIVKPASAASAIQIARIYQIPAASPLATLSPILSSNMPVITGSANANAIGQTDAQNGYFAFGAPGHGVTLFKVDFLTQAPPTVGAPSGGGVIIGGLTNSLSVIPSGSTPFGYQWYFTNGVATNAIIGAITNLYTLAPAQPTNAGGYFVIVTNLYGRATSGVVNLTVIPNGSSSLMTNLWSIAGGSRSYVPGAGTTTSRGLGYDPVLQRVVVVSRVPTNGVWVLDAATGAEVGSLDASVIPGTGFGTLSISMCGVADDGKVYVANLCNGGSEPFLIYQFDSATDGAALLGAAYNNTVPGLFTSFGRIGDSMAVRGAGTNTQIICGSRNSGTNVAIFTTADGVNFDLNVVAIDTANQEIAGLSVYWGAGNTFWTKTDSLNNLRQVSFDLNTLTASVIGSYPLLSTETIIGVDSANGYVSAIGARENPQSVGIYDINALSFDKPIDREFFAGSTAGANLQATGQSAVDVAGGRIFSLSTGTGLLAVKYAGKLSIAKDGVNQVVSWPVTNATLQSATVVSGPYTDVSGATTPYTNSTGAVKFYRLRN